MRRFKGNRVRRHFFFIYCCPCDKQQKVVERHVIIVIDIIYLFRLL